ncbi:UPF0280 family protein [Dehalogenimonas etheniformans]|uniref:Uncharacterized protein n=1 Tax=Dehalogenimonas etheniformans TaxID=1536648 RepID=A0A2P5P4P9_9CHLR|nr:UPF0280 family protein [Dehalogenimonas etheniformans]PPD57271.1 hypothetical protein JP09_010300 [Dehalogenimonas etheniformans]QNT76190.1 UPF0280 family protein [Dehalogenimonas etheniformans]
MYQPRTYRKWHESADLVSFTVSVNETNLFVSARVDLERKARKLVLKYRSILENYIAGHPTFLTSLKPVEIEADAPLIVRDMAETTNKVGVGPMASVAGAVAQFVGEELLEYSPDIIIENGGDIYITSTRERVIGIYAGDSPLSGKLGIEIFPNETPCGICTSSGTVGHSLSFGKADAVTIVAPSAILADAGATACGNVVQTSADIERGLELASKIAGVSGAIIIVGERVGAWGSVRLKHL